MLSPKNYQKLLDEVENNLNFSFTEDVNTEPEEGMYEIKDYEINTNLGITVVVDGQLTWGYTYRSSTLEQPEEEEFEGVNFYINDFKIYDDLEDTEIKLNTHQERELLEIIKEIIEEAAYN